MECKRPLLSVLASAHEAEGLCNLLYEGRQLLGEGVKRKGEKQAEKVSCVPAAMALLAPCEID